MWEWSHTQEAYDFAREQLGKLPINELIEIAQAWNEKLETGHFDLTGKIYDDVLSDWIWEQASSWEHGRNCSNGGRELYLDPEGYHTVDLREMPDDWQPSEY